MTAVALSPDRTRSAASTNSLLTGRDAIVPLAAAVLLLVPGILAFGPVFGDATGYVAAAGGVLLGLALGAFSRFRRWPLLTTVAAFVGAYLVFGGVFALRQTTLLGFIPTLDTLLRLLPLSVQSWRDLLTVRPPAGSFVGPAVVPYLTGMVAGVFTARLAAGVRRYLWALVPGTAFLLVGILWGIDEPAAAGVLGVVLAAVGLLWAAWRQQRGTTQTGDEVLAGGSAVSGTRTLALAAGLVAASAVLSMLAAPFIAPTSRTVLRQYVQPPLNLKDYASPLTSFRYLVNDQKETPLFTVTGLPENGRIRLATMDAYDGRVYNVDQDSARFLRIGQTVYGAANGKPEHLDVTIAEYQGVWVPGSGDLKGVSFTGSRADQLAEGLYYNSYGGTLLTTPGLAKDDHYKVDLVVPNTVDDKAAQRIAQVPVGEVQRVPDVISEKATELIGDKATPIEQLRALEKGLQDEGYYVSGAKSLPGHSMGRISSMMTAPILVGDEEQYAVVFALMARQLGYPSRVVLGFHADPAKKYASTGPLEMTGQETYAWVEVPFEGVGWVTFDPTPKRDKVPETTVPKPRPKPRPQVLPPPDPPINMLQDAMDKPGSNEDADKPGDDFLMRVVVAAAVVVLGGALIASPFVLIAWLKSRRRERRRHADNVAERLSGAWAELEDAAVDQGTKVPLLVTRREASEALAAACPDAGLPGVAAAIDAGVFGPGAPTESAAASVWTDVESSLAAMAAGRNPLLRFRSFVSLRSFRRRSRGLRLPRISLPSRKAKA